MISRVREYFLKSYLKFHEPRVISALYGVVYVISLAIGIYNFFDPPTTILLAADNPWLVYLSAGTITIGGGGGLYTVITGNYWAERTPVTSLLVGLGIYWLISLWITVFGTGSQYMSLMTKTFAIILVALRFYWILDRPKNPNR